MSVRIMSDVWSLSEATGSARLVLLAIADCANDEDRIAWPSVALIAKKTRLDRTTVMRAVDELGRLGELTTTRRFGIVNHYVVGHFSEQISLRDDPSQPATGRNPRPVAESDPDQSQPATPPVATCDLTSRTRATRTIKNHKEPSGEPSGARAKVPHGWRSVPDGELLTEARRSDAVRLGVPPPDVGREWDDMLDHEFKSPHVSVDKTWRRWCREHVRRMRLGAYRGSGGNPKTAGNAGAIARFGTKVTA